MKKGSSHVDWAISMSLFLVFVLLTIMFLRPGVEQPYDADILLEVINEKFIENVSYKNELNYLMISPNIDLSTVPEVNGKYDLRIKKASDYGMNSGWIISEEQGLRLLTLTNESLGKVPAETLKGESLPFDIINDYCITHPGDCNDEDRDVLDIKTPLKDGDNIFWFIYSDYETFNHGEAHIEWSDEQCQEEDGGGRIRNCLLNHNNGGGEDFEYNFGVMETYSGISCKKLKELKENFNIAADYELLKRQWGVPTDKNFNLTLTSASLDTTCAGLILEPVWNIDPTTIDPTLMLPQTNIYVKELETWILDFGNYMVPAKLSIELW